MSNPFNVITRETFETLNDSGKLGIVFDIVTSIHANCSAQQNTCAQRFDKIEKRKWVSVVASAGGGLVGGFIAIISKIKIFG